MPQVLIRADRLGKRFRRSWHTGLLYGLADYTCRILRRERREGLRPGEFWALQDISFELRQGECLGVIGPNGAGKSTLLRLLNREFRPDRGAVVTQGATQSLIRIGSGLQALLSGRENIYIQCAQLGLDKRATDARIDEIIAFAELERAIDAPVKTYSDGMYARLEFAIATSVTMDILLVDEVLAVGDVAFQLRCLDRLNQLKRSGTTVVFVSHSEMNVRQVADRCLLLFDGRQVGLGEPDALFYQYYAAIGYLNRTLKPLGISFPQPHDCDAPVAIAALRVPGLAAESVTAVAGAPMEFELTYECQAEVPAAVLIVQFWNPAHVLIASIDSRLAGRTFSMRRGRGAIRLHSPFLSLSAGVYQVAAGVAEPDGRWLGYSGRALTLHVKQEGIAGYSGLVFLDASFETV